MAKRSREEWKTYGNVFDNFTARVLDKLISQGHFTGLVAPISVGKESNVFSARTKDGNFVAVKIYRLESCDFNRMFEYIRYDSRFIGMKKQRRKVIFTWVQREFRNLMKAREFGINVPTPISFNNNVLVEEFIGNEHAAYKLKDSFPLDPKKFYDKVIYYIKILAENNYVHGDLSHFNILNYKEKPVLIDFSTMTIKEDPNFIYYLERDIKNICNFATRQGYNLDYEKTRKKIFEKI